MEETALISIGFAEWLYNNRWHHFDKNKKVWNQTFEHPTVMGDKTYKKHHIRTTGQLFIIYLSTL